MSKMLDFMGGLVIGFVAAAAIGLLFTPKSGEDLQQGIRDHIQEAIDEGRAAQAAKREELERAAGIRPA